MQSDFQAQSKTFSLSCPSKNSAFRWGQVSLPCLSLLHDLSTHPDIAPTVQSKASCIHREPHTRSGLGLSVLKYGCLNGLSASYITLQQEGQQASEAIPDTKPYPCSYCASGAKKKKSHCLPRVTRSWHPLHPARGAQSQALQVDQHPSFMPVDQCISLCLTPAFREPHLEVE